MKLSQTEIDALKSILKKIDDEKKNQKIRIDSRRKSQLKGQTVVKLIQKRRKPFTKRKTSKRRSSIR